MPRGRGPGKTQVPWCPPPGCLCCGLAQPGPRGRGHAPPAWGPPMRPLAQPLCSQGPACAWPGRGGMEGRSLLCVRDAHAVSEGGARPGLRVTFRARIPVGSYRGQRGAAVGRGPQVGEEAASRFEAGRRAGDRRQHLAGARLRAPAPGTGSLGCGSRAGPCPQGARPLRTWPWGLVSARAHSGCA